MIKRLLSQLLLLRLYTNFYAEPGIFYDLWSFRLVSGSLSLTPTIVSDKLRRTWPAVVKWEEGKNGGQVG